MAEADLKYSITKFNGTDYCLWKDKILNALTAAELDTVIKDDFNLNEGEDNEKKDKKKKDEKAKVILMSSIQDNILRNIPRDTSKNIWNALTAKYEANNVQNIVSLRRRLMNSKHGNNETIEEYIDRIKSLRNEIEKAENAQIREQDVAIVILQGLSQEYDNFVQVLILNAKTLKVDDIAISLIQEEHRRSEKKQESKNSEGDVFYSKEKQYKRRKNGKYTVKCYNCNKMGHIAKDCRSPKRDRSNKNANLSMKTEKDQSINKEEIVFHISEKLINIKNA